MDKQHISLPSSNTCFSNNTLTTVTTPSSSSCSSHIDGEKEEGMKERESGGVEKEGNYYSYYCKHQKQYYEENKERISHPQHHLLTQQIREEPKVRAEHMFPYPLHQHITYHYLLHLNNTTLAVTVRIPSSKGKYITLLEFLPYRMVDGTTSRDTKQLPFLVGCGLAICRVDMRGSGDSEGELLDEYLLQEQLDGEVLCDWISTQDWCNGDVIMWGISWGGFNSLQIAFDRHPPSLKAIIPLAFSDHRYLTDVHYHGGFVHAIEVLFSLSSSSSSSSPSSSSSSSSFSSVSK